MFVNLEIRELVIHQNDMILGPFVEEQEVFIDDSFSADLE